MASSLKRKYEENHEDADYRIGEVEMMSENAMPRALGPSKQNEMLGLNNQAMSQSLVNAMMN